VKKFMTGVVFVLFISLAWAPGASATDGHFLHGVGAINSAMGGVGVAGAKDLLGAFYHNPAGLMAFEGSRFDLSMEMFKADRTLTATAPTQQGPFTGSQRSKSEFVPIPAFGWSTELNDGKVVVGSWSVSVVWVSGVLVSTIVRTTRIPSFFPRPWGDSARSIAISLS